MLRVSLMALVVVAAGVSQASAQWGGPPSVSVRGPNGSFYLGSNGFHISSRSNDGGFIWGGSKDVGYSAIVGRNGGSYSVVTPNGFGIGVVDSQGRRSELIIPKSGSPQLRFISPSR